MPTESTTPCSAQSPPSDLESRCQELEECVTTLQRRLHRLECRFQNSLSFDQEVEELAAWLAWRDFQDQLELRPE